MVGFTTQSHFDFTVSMSHQQRIYPEIYYEAVYKLSLPVNLSIDRVIRPPHYYLVRDEFAFGWYKISRYHIESLLRNASMEINDISKMSIYSKSNKYKNEVWSHDEL